MSRPDPRSQAKRGVIFWLREITAILLWSLALTKLILFDFDVYLIQRFAPGQTWLLTFKFLIFAAAIAVLWLVSGHRSLIKLAAYVAGYPLILIFWRLPRVCFKRWPLVIAFAPALYPSLKRLRSTFILYTGGLISAVLALSSRGVWELRVAIAGMFLFLVAHLFRSLREAFGVSLFADLARVTRKVTASGVKVVFDTATRSSASSTQSGTHPPDPLVSVYFLHAVADIVASRVADVIKTRKYDIYLIASWFYTLVLTTFLFAFQYLALSRLDVAAFTSTTPLGLLRFVQFSAGILTTAGGSGVQAVSPVASLFCSVEYFCIPLILVMFVFSLLTTQRQGYREDAEDFRLAVREFSEAIEGYVAVTYQLTALTLESVVQKRNASLVSALRRARGVPELAETPAPEGTPRSVPAESSDEGSSTGV